MTVHQITDCPVCAERTRRRGQSRDRGVVRGREKVAAVVCLCIDVASRVRHHHAGFQGKNLLGILAVARHNDNGA